MIALDQSIKYSVGQQHIQSLQQGENNSAIFSMKLEELEEDWGVNIKNKTNKSQNEQRSCWKNIIKMNNERQLTVS